jgi:hypothetical protein
MQNECYNTSTATNKQTKTAKNKLHTLQKNML